jgi:hypothetical protein
MPDFSELGQFPPAYIPPYTLPKRVASAPVVAPAPVAAPAAAAPELVPTTAREWRDLAISKGVTGINSRDNITTIKSKAKKQNIVLGEGFAPKGSGFKSLSSYPPHIIAGALHFVKQRKKLSTNQNEYNREQARNLLNKALKK